MSLQLACGWEPEGEYDPPPRPDQTPAELVTLGKSFTQTNYWFRRLFPLFPSTLLLMLKQPSASPTMTSRMEPRGCRRMTPVVNNVHVAVAARAGRRQRSKQVRILLQNGEQKKNQIKDDVFQSGALHSQGALQPGCMCTHTLLFILHLCKVGTNSTSVLPR